MRVGIRLRVSLLALVGGPHRDRPLLGLCCGDLGRWEDLLDEARRGVALLVPTVSAPSNTGLWLGLGLGLGLGLTAPAPSTGRAGQASDMS